jgi:sporulation protein YqfC
MNIMKNPVCGGRKSLKRHAVGGVRLVHSQKYEAQLKVASQRQLFNLTPLLGIEILTEGFFVRFRELRNQVKRKAMAALELPGEVTLDLPKITLTGNILVSIENHRGIASFGSDAVRVLVQAGEVVVSGLNLMIRSISPDELIIEGEIQGVTLV